MEAIESGLLCYVETGYCEKETFDGFKREVAAPHTNKCLQFPQNSPWPDETLGENRRQHSCCCRDKDEMMQFTYRMARP